MNDDLSDDAKAKQPAKRIRRKKRQPPRARPANEPALPTGISWDHNAGQYRVRVTWKSRQYTVGRYFPLTHAKAALELARADIARREFVPPSEQRRLERLQQQKMDEEKRLEQERQLTVKQWCKVWLDTLENGSEARSPGTISSYRSTLNAHILPPLGHELLTDVTPEKIDACIAVATKSGIGASRNVARTLRAAFNAAVAIGAGGIESSPVQVKIPKKATGTRQDDEVPSLEEVSALAGAMTPETELAVLLAAWCSLRVGEVIGLQRGDFKNLDKPGKASLNIDRQWLSKATPPDYGPPKDDSYRTVAVPDLLAKKVATHLDKYVADASDAPVFPSPRNRERPISHNALSSRWNEARAQVRPGTDFHALRHFGLTMYARAGATQTEIMRRGGHRDVDAAQRYQHSSIERDQQHTAQLNEWMDQGQEGKK